MSIEVIPYTGDWKASWDSFVLQSNNGTIFHLQRFLEYHRERKFSWHHLLFRRRDAIVAVLPAAVMGSTLESPIGASYGSFVTGDLSFSDALELVDSFSEYCRNTGFERALLTPAPFIYQRRLSQNLDYALAYRGFEIDKHYISHSVPLTVPDLVGSFQATTRRYVHKYLREGSLRIEQSTDLDSFYPILVKNKERHGVAPTHSLEELKILQRRFPEDIILFLVTRNRKPIAGSLIFACNPEVVLCFYNMLLYEYERFHPIHAAMFEVLSWARQRGFRWLDIGVSQDTHSDNQMTPAMSLIRFKEQFNSRGILRTTIYKRFI